MKKTTILYIILVFCLFFTPITASASASSSNYVIDKSDSFTGFQLDFLHSKAVQAERESSFAFRVYIYEEVFDTYVGEDYLRDYGYDESDDLVLLILSQYNGVWYYDLYTYGDADRQLSDSEVNAILDAPSVYNNLKSGDLTLGLERFFAICPSYLINDEINGLTVGGRILRALAIGAVVALISSVGVYLFYKRKSRSASYPLHEFTRLELTNSQDIFAGDVVTRRYAPRNTSSGSRSGGGGGRGGGGGHRGGR